MKEITTKNSQAGFPLTLKSANQNKYPIIYAEDEWQIIDVNSKLYALLGSKAGSYTQQEINEAIASSVNALPIEIVDTLPTTGTANTLYLLTTSSGSDTDSATLFTRYVYKNSAWVNQGDVSINLGSYIKSTEDGTEGNIAAFSGTKSLKDGGVAVSDLSTIVGDYKSTTEGALGKLLADYKNGTIAGSKDAATEDADGLFTADEKKILNTYKTTITADSDFVTNIKAAMTKIGLDAFIVPIAIPISNYFGFTTSQQRYSLARIAKKGNSEFEATFSIGYMDYIYYSATDKLYYTKYDVASDNDSTHSLV